MEFSENPFELRGWYVTFEADEKTAIEKAVRLVKENAEQIHCQKVKAFLEKVKINSGNKDFDKFWIDFVEKRCNNGNG